MTGVLYRFVSNQSLVKVRPLPPAARVLPAVLAVQAARLPRPVRQLPREAPPVAPVVAAAPVAPVVAAAPVAPVVAAAPVPVAPPVAPVAVAAPVPVAPPAQVRQVARVPQSHRHQRGQQQQHHQQAKRRHAALLAVL